MLQFKHSYFLTSLLFIGFSGYLPVQAEELVHNACEQISTKLSSVHLQECLNNKLTDSSHRSNQNRPLLVREYPPVGTRQPQARVLLIGGIHGDEYSSVSVVFKWLNILDQYHSGLFHWKVIPLLNPDGLLLKRAQRTNGNGVDLNRNFSPGDNKHASLEYWKQRTWQDKRRYPGPAPLSEPESRWIAQLINEFNPDVVIAVHAPFGILDFDGPHQAPKHLGPLHLKLLGTYPGSLGNYAGIQLGKPVITIELPHAGIMPTNQEISKIWVDLVSWLKRNARSADSDKLLKAESGALNKHEVID